MNLLRRLLALFRIKSDRLLERAEDPRESLDDAYGRQLQLLARVRRGLVDVATARKRVELQGAEFAQTRQRLEAQARQALAAGREDLAREALTRRATIDSQLGDLSTQHAKLADDEAGLVEAASRFQAKVDAFRLQKETIKATYTAADAQVRVRESLSGVSEEMNDLGRPSCRPVPARSMTSSPQVPSRISVSRPTGSRPSSTASRSARASMVSLRGFGVSCPPARRERS